MLKQLLSISECTECKICCKFEEDELIDAPTFTKQEKEYVLSKINENIEFIRKGEVFQIVLIPYNNKYICPLLKSNGCILKEKKPFDCASWPFYLMKDKQSYLIAMSPDCPAIRNKTKTILQEYIKNNFLDAANEIINYYPDMITDYSRNMEVLYRIKNNKHI